MEDCVCSIGMLCKSISRYSLVPVCTHTQTHTRTHEDVPVCAHVNVQICKYVHGASHCIKSCTTLHAATKCMSNDVKCIHATANSTVHPHVRSCVWFGTMAHRCTNSTILYVLCEHVFFFVFFVLQFRDCDFF